jgi:hypothetical protein
MKVRKAAYIHTTYWPMGKLAHHSQIWKLEIFLLLHHISKCLCAYSQLVNFVDKAIIMPLWRPIDKLEK